MDVALYQERRYDPAPLPCWALVADVLITERGITLDVCTTVTDSVRAAALAFRLELHKGTHGFQQIAEPVDFAVVLMARTVKIGIHHCGIFYQGKVLHALEDATLYQDLASLRDAYQVIEFWARGL